MLDMTAYLSSHPRNNMSFESFARCRSILGIVCLLKSTIRWCRTWIAVLAIVASPAHRTESQVCDVATLAQVHEREML